jgi:hypothetical protein
MTAPTLTPTTTTGTRPLLPGQTADPQGPVDLTVMFVVHHAFRRDLAWFAAAAAHTPADDRATWRLLHRRWELFSTVLHQHHGGEDAGLWPLLLERAAAAHDVDARRTLEAMSAEHADIDPLLEACAAGFARLATSADDDARAALAVRLVAAREHLARHLRHEETEALVLVQRYLTQVDWERLEKEHFKADHSFRQTLALVAWVLQGLPQDALRRLPGRGFRRRERQAFRYVPSPPVL